MALPVRIPSFLFFLLLIVLSASSLAAWPPVKVLSAGDPVFVQFSQDVERSRRLLASGADGAVLLDHLVFYEWESDGSMDILSIAARCALPYDSIASLNGIGRSGPVDAGTRLLLPSIPGLYVFADGSGDLGWLLAARLNREPGAAQDADSPRLSLTLGGRSCSFFPDASFNPTERAFFLNAAFRLPLPAGRLTSSWGYRSDPFTGKRHFHRGIDLAAPAGTEVYAARDGVVSFVGEDRTYGRYIVISHENGWTSLYGHLSKVETSLHKKVRSGSIVGRVGSTGLSTGPHLHFELRSNGDARNPGELLPKGF